MNEPGSDRIVKNILWLCYSDIYPGDLIEGREEVEEMQRSQKMYQGEREIEIRKRGSMERRIPS